ncbi:MAG: hypothetical protein NTX65_10460 [Ignavibacteriales bacterium]|nr:hypothetical protein [Ignavibacteriales bacterium]
MNTNSMNISHHNHIDDMFELVVADKKPEHTTSQIIAESSHVFSQENHNKIWKPPVNS